MNAEEITNAVKSEPISGVRQVISHSKRPETTYAVMEFTWVDIEGVWVLYISYMDTETNILYARRADQFYNFSFGVGYGQF